MRRKIFLSLAAVFAIFGCGAFAALLYLDSTTESLRRLIELYRVDHIRQDLLINVQAVQTNFYRVATPFSEELDFIVDNVSALDVVVAKCGDCHHDSDLAAKIAGLQGLVGEYKDALSYYITASANAQRIERLKHEAAAVGDRVLALSQEMVGTASDKLQRMTEDSLARTESARLLLLVSLLAALILIAVVGAYLTGFVTRPVNALLAATRKIASGEVGCTTGYDDRTEFGELARNFNAMSSALQRGQEDAREKQLRIAESERKFRTITEFSYDWEYWIDPQKAVVFMSSSCETVTGYSREEFIQDPELLRRIIVPEDRPLYERHFAAEVASKRQEIQFRIRTKSGDTLWLSHVCGPVQTADGFQGRFASNRDITDRRELEEQLLQSRKMESLGTMAGGIAHDFNNLLTAILGYASILERRLPEADPKVKGAIRHIVTAAERAEELTANMLTFSRKRAMKPRPVDVNQVLRQAEGLLRRSLPEDIELRIQCRGEPLFALADPHQIDHALMNLVTNARDALPGGGRIEIGAAPADPDSALARKRGAKFAEGVVIAVRDSGTGIEPQDLPHIFEPFFTTKGVDKGTGLGLATVYGIMEQHGGFVDVETEKGRGTAFHLYFPPAARPEPEDVPKERAVEPAGSNGGDRTVLIAEDEATVRSFLQDALEDRGYRVIAAVDGEDAIRKYEENKARIDLVILDVVMPRKNGMDVYEHIRRADAAVPALLMSGYTRDILTSKGVFGDDVEVIQKPLKVEVLAAKIEKMIETES